MSIKRNSSRGKRRYFTLVEIMITLALVIGLGGIFAFQAREWLATQAALEEMENALRILKRAQELSLMANFDSEVVFEKGKEGWEFTFIPRSSTPPRLSDLVQLKTYKFNKVDNILFQPPGGEVQEAKKWPLSFIAKGFFMPEGQLIFKSGSLSRSIFFLGYPSNFVLSPSQEKMPGKEKLRDQLERIIDKVALETKGPK